MKDQSKQSNTPPSLEEGVNALVTKARKGIIRRYQRCESQVRKSPASSVMGAVAVGYFLHRMPVGAILATQVRVLSALTPPALVLFGAAKVCEFLQRPVKTKRN